MFSNPVNPTGTVFTEKEIRMIGELAIEHDLYIIGDEVYRQFVYDDETEFLSVMKLDHLQDRVVIVDSISKHYSACGARIGLVASKNHELMAQILKFCQARSVSYTHLTLPTTERV